MKRGEHPSIHTVLRAWLGVLIVLTLTGRDSVVTRALSLKWLRTLGLVSYGLYLWHWPVKVCVTGQRLHLPDDTTGRIALFLIRVAITAAATAACGPLFAANPAAAFYLMAAMALTAILLLAAARRPIVALFEAG